MSIGSWVLSLFGIRTLTQGFLTVPDQPYLEVDPSFATVTPDPLNQRNILSGPSGGAVTATTVTATSVTVGNATWTSGPIVPTTVDTVAELLTVPLAIPASGSLRLVYIVESKITTAAVTVTSMYEVAVKWTRGGVAAPMQPFLNQGLENDVPGPPFLDNTAGATFAVLGTASGAGSAVVLEIPANTASFAPGGAQSVTVSGVGGTTEAIGTWAFENPDATHLLLRGSTFANAWTSGGTVLLHGCVVPIAVGNTAHVQAVGIKPALWIHNETVTGGTVRYAAGSGNTYVCTMGGVTAAAGGGPTGTTTFTEGTGVQWAFHSAGRVCNIAWRATEYRYSTT